MSPAPVALTGAGKGIRWLAAPGTRVSPALPNGMHLPHPPGQTVPRAMQGRRGGPSDDGALSDAGGLPGEDEAEIDLLAIVGDAAAGSDDDGFVVKRIVEIGQAGIGTR